MNEGYRTKNTRFKGCRNCFLLYLVEKFVNEHIMDIEVGWEGGGEGKINVITRRGWGSASVLDVQS